MLITYKKVINPNNFIWISHYRILLKKVFTNVQEVVLHYNHVLLVLDSTYIVHGGQVTPWNGRWNIIMLVRTGSSQVMPVFDSTYTITSLAGRGQVTRLAIKSNQIRYIDRFDWIGLINELIRLRHPRLAQEGQSTSFL